MRVCKHVHAIWHLITIALPVGHLHAHLREHLHQMLKDELALSALAIRNVHLQLHALHQLILQAIMPRACFHGGSSSVVMLPV